MGIRLPFALVGSNHWVPTRVIDNRHYFCVFAKALVRYLSNEAMPFLEGGFLRERIDERLDERLLDFRLLDFRLHRLA